MSIWIDEKKRIFTLNTQASSYQMMADDLGYLLHLYYGKPLACTMDYLLTYLDRGFSGNPQERAIDKIYSLDALPQEFPFKGSGDYRSVCLCTEDADGNFGCDLRYVGYRIQKGKYELKGLPAARGSFNLQKEEKETVETLSILLKDRFSGLEVELLYGVYEKSNIITRAAIIKNAGKSRTTIKKAATVCLDFLSGSYDLVHFHGRHTMERQFERTEIRYAAVSIGSRRGTSSHQHNPAVILAEKNACEQSGTVYGCCLSYSGGFLCEAEKDQFGQTRLVMGMTDDQLEYPLEPSEELVLPECLLTCSDGGFRALTHTYHNFIRKYIIREPSGSLPEKRPILINSWETAYFDFDGEKIVQLAREAAELGVGMVVMDDGWFGGRKDDFAGLGDWQVNEKKLGMSLGELIGKVEDTGLKFGIWIEPEMINEDSDLFRAHPDWALHIPGRPPIYARNQLVLDFSRKDIRDHIFDSICSCLDQGHVSYVKWDMNRSICEVCSAENTSGTVQYRYVLGVYEFLKRLTERYPNMLIEGCSGGGGRFDTGMLSYTPQIWCSDNTDAVDRTRIQYGTSFFYPASAVGAHVSAVPNHQTGRITPLITRGIVAMAGTFGFELDPAKLDDSEKEAIKKMMVLRMNYADLICHGDYYRLSDPSSDGIAAWAFADGNGDRMLLSIVRLENHAGMDVKYIKAAGLEAGAEYHISTLLCSKELSADEYEAMKKSVRIPESLSGSALMNAGIPLLPTSGEYESEIILFEKTVRSAHAL